MSLAVAALIAGFENPLHTATEVAVRADGCSSTPLPRSRRSTGSRRSQRPVPSRRPDGAARRDVPRAVAAAVASLGLRSRAGVSPAPARAGVATKLFRSVHTARRVREDPGGERFSAEPISVYLQSAVECDDPRDQQETTAARLISPSPVSAMSRSPHHVHHENSTRRGCRIRPTSARVR